jgi:hypothetical protein
MATTRWLRPADLEFRRRVLAGLSPLQRDIVHALLTAVDEPDDVLAARHEVSADDVRKERSRAIAIVQGILRDGKRTA